MVRCGATSTGLPIGVQIAAAPWREDIVLAVTLQLDEIFGDGKRRRRSLRGIADDSAGPLRVVLAIADEFFAQLLAGGLDVATRVDRP